MNYTVCAEAFDKIALVYQGDFTRHKYLPLLA